MLAPKLTAFATPRGGRVADWETQIRNDLAPATL